MLSHHLPRSLVSIPTSTSYHSETCIIIYGRMATQALRPARQYHPATAFTKVYMYSPHPLGRKPFLRRLRLPSRRALSRACTDPVRKNARRWHKKIKSGCFVTCGCSFTLCALHHTDLYLLILSAVIFGISLTGFRWPWSATEMIVYCTVFVRAKLAPA